MKTFRLLKFIGFLSLVLLACKKKDTPQPVTPSVTLSFIELTSENKAVPLGGKTKVTATAEGSNLSYFWSTNTGSTIIGSGYQVEFFAGCTSCLGPNEVTCKVTDDSGNSESKMLPITVM